jgi:uncharacterized glyoxalase superfamily protein PhnB
MRLNRSVPPCAVIPVLIYPDPTAAADWLSKAFGFTVRLRIANHRIQMKAGEGSFTIAEGSVSPNNSHIVQVRIEDAKGHCERARQNGAIILTEPQDQPYGERQYNTQDFYGHRWDFTETIADVAPEEWSGGAFHLE